MQTLKDNINGNVEKGFGIYNGSYNDPPLPNPSFSSIIDGTGQEGPPIGFLPIMKAVVHNHLTDSIHNHIGTFTPRDIVQIANVQSMLQNASSSVQEKEIATYLVCDEGNYALKINDGDKLYDFVNKYGTDVDFKDRIDKFYEDSNMTHGKAKNDQNIGFLTLMKDFDLGVDLYEADENFENWEKLELNDTNNINRNPC